MSKLMLSLLALALAAPFAGLALAEVVGSARTTAATATEIDHALHAAIPTLARVEAAGPRTAT